MTTDHANAPAKVTEAHRELASNARYAPMWENFAQQMANAERAAVEKATRALDAIIAELTRANNRQANDITRLVNERAAWRNCAEKLAAQLRRYIPPTLDEGSDVAAIAEFDALKAKEAR